MKTIESIRILDLKKNSLSKEVLIQIAQEKYTAQVIIELNNSKLQVLPGVAGDFLCGIGIVEEESDTALTVIEIDGQKYPIAKEAFDAIQLSDEEIDWEI